MDAVAANGDVTHTHVTSESNNIVNATPVAKMDDDAGTVRNPKIAKDDRYEWETNDASLSNEEIENTNYDTIESVKIVNTDVKTDSNDSVDSVETTDKMKVDGNLHSDTVEQNPKGSVESVAKIDADDAARSIEDSTENASRIDSVQIDSKITDGGEVDHSNRKPSVTEENGLNDMQNELSASDQADGPLPSQDNSEQDKNDSVPNSPGPEQKQSNVDETILSEEGKESPSKVDDYLDERQSPEGSSNDSPRQPSPHGKPDTLKSTEDVLANKEESGQKQLIEQDKESNDRPETDTDESEDPKTEDVKSIDDNDGLKSNNEEQDNQETKQSSEKRVDADDGLLTSVRNTEETSKEASEATPTNSDEAAIADKRDGAKSLTETPEPSNEKVETNVRSEKESNSAITKSSDQRTESQHQHSNNDTHSNNVHLKSEKNTKDSDSVDSNVAVVKPMVRSSREESTKGEDDAPTTSVEDLDTSATADISPSKEESGSPEDNPNAIKNSEKTEDESDLNVADNVSNDANAENLQTGDVIPVGQPPLSTQLQTDTAKTNQKTESETPEPAKSDNDDVLDNDALMDDNEMSDQGANESGNNCENNSPDAGGIIHNKPSDNKDVDETKGQIVEVEKHTDNDGTTSESKNQVEVEKHTDNEGTANNETKDQNVGVKGNDDNVDEGTVKDTVKDHNKEVKGDTDDQGLHDQSAEKVKDDVDSKPTKEENNTEVKGEMIHELDIREQNDETTKQSNVPMEEKTEVASEKESPVEEPLIQPETAQIHGTPDEGKEQPVEPINDTANDAAKESKDSNINSQTPMDEDANSKKKISVTSQTTEEKVEEPDPVPEKVQKDDFTKWLLEEEAQKLKEKNDQRGQDRTPTPVRRPTPEPTTEELSTEEEYKEPTLEEKKAEEIQNDKRGKDSNKGESRAGTNQRGEDSRNKEDLVLPAIVQAQKAKDETDNKQDAKPSQSDKTKKDQPQTKRKESARKSSTSSNQKPNGHRRSIRALKPIQSEKPSEDRQRPVQRSKPIEANKPASRQRPVTRERTAPPPKRSTGSRPETTNGRIRHPSTSSNGRLLQRETTRISQKSQRPKTTGVRDSNDGRAEQKEFFRKELTRIEEGLKKEVSKIQKPTQKKHTPFIFNDLKPYYDTTSQRYLIETPEEMQHCYSSRKTAIGLIDPWKNLEMDKSVLPVLESKPVNRGDAQKKKEKKIDDRAKKTKHEGSTRLPKYPVVTLETSDLATKKLYYSDVPMLREELKQKYSANATKKVEEDYEKTKQDFYRMDLDKLNDVHPVNREHMRSTYFAYLQNTPGSKKAINECVKSIDKAAEKAK